MVVRFLCAGLLALTLAYGAFTITLSTWQDLKIDSREAAETWIKQELPSNAFIGTNEFCSGPSPARDISSNIHLDEYMKREYEFYIFNSYYPSVLFSYYRSKNFVQTVSQKYSHFYHYNDTDLLKWRLNDNLANYVPNGYQVLKRFALDGPEIVILQKVSNR